MIKKSDIVREAVREQDWKKALLVAKDFRIGVTQEQRSKMARAYECIVHPDFYRQIGVGVPEALSSRTGQGNSKRICGKHKEEKHYDEMGCKA